LQALDLTLQNCSTLEEETMFSLHNCSRPQGLLSTSVLMLSLSLANGSLVAQTIASTKEGSTVPVGATKASAAAAESYVDYLKAFELAETGSKPAALHLLAESLRLQPGNVAASRLSFRLLTEQRADTALKLQGHTGVITSASFSPDGTRILTTSTDHTARVWDARTGLQLTPAFDHDDEVVSGVFSRDGRQIATGTDGGKIAIWDSSTGKKLVSTMELKGSAWSVTFSPDGKTVAAASEEGKARIWDAATGNPLSPLIEYHESAYSVSFSSDGKSLLIATGDDFADLRDSRTGKRIFRFPRRNTIYSAQFSPDDKRIVTACADATAETWDAHSGAPTGVVMSHGFGVGSAEFNSDASLIVTASRDHTARIWNANSGKLMGTLQHPTVVGKAAFSPDSRLVATVAGDRAVRLWDTRSGDQIQLPTVTSGGSPNFSFSPDGSSLLIAGGSSGWVLDLPPNDEAPSWLGDVADFASTLNNFDQARKPDLSGMEAIRAKLTSSKGTDQWTVFGKWYFADITQRPVSPWSHLSLESYVNLLIARGDRSSLEYAKALSRPFPSWLAKVNASLAKLPPEQASEKK
jgi:WD40 repeat protein